MKEEIIDVDERGNLLAAESTTNYGLIKPGQDDFYNVDDFNQNMDTIDKQLKVNESQIKTLENQIQNIDVSGDIRHVINERVNADTSKPLSTLISEWVNAAKTAILNGINGLPQKSIWSDERGAKLDNLNQSMTTTQTNVTNNADKNKDTIVNWTTSCRDNVNSTVNEARDNIKNHITASRGGDVSGKTYVKATKTIENTGNPNSNLEVINYSNSKGGVCKIAQYGSADMQIIVDDVMVFDNVGAFFDHTFMVGSSLSSCYGELPTYPFKNNVKVVDRSNNQGTRMYTAHFYVNS